ncbi:MAG: class I SAM-dependent methyltransferase [Anaerolineae bacterium]
MYEQYAEVFAASSGHREYNARLAAFLPDFLARMGETPTTILDVACGVGDLALGLAQRGYAVTAVDLAPAMVAIAREKAADAGLAAAFEVADMRALPYRDTFDLALCFGDSLNYMLTPADVRKALTSMYRALRPGGLVIFDVLTASAIETFYAGEAYILQNTDDVFEAHENDYNPDTQVGTLTVTAFVRRPDGAFERVRETHYQRGYPPEAVDRWVARVGFVEPTWFTDWEIADTLEDDSGEATRVFCLARRPLAEKAVKA